MSTGKQIDGIWWVQNRQLSWESELSYTSFVDENSAVITSLRRQVRSTSSIYLPFYADALICCLQAHWCYLLWQRIFFWWRWNRELSSSKYTCNVTMSLHKCCSLTTVKFIEDSLLIMTELGSIFLSPAWLYNYCRSPILNVFARP